MSNLTVLSEYSSIVGLALTIVGFIFTIITILSSKKVAVEAKNAAQGVRDDLLKVDTISDLSKAIAIIEEIKRMNRSRSYISIWLAPAMTWSSLGSFAFLNASWLQKSVSALEPAMTSSGLGEMVSSWSNGKKAIWSGRLDSVYRFGEFGC